MSLLLWSIKYNMTQCEQVTKAWAITWHAVARTYMLACPALVFVMRLASTYAVTAATLSASSTTVLDTASVAMK